MSISPLQTWFGILHSVPEQGVLTQVQTLIVVPGDLSLIYPTSVSLVMFPPCESGDLEVS